MVAFANRAMLSWLLLCALGAVGQPPARPSETAIRGWLSDEKCAHGRAESGLYTATSPRCAKECVAKGRKIVLIDPDRKMIFAIVNQGLARTNVGDYVEIAGQMDLPAKTVHIASLKMLAKGSASCARPKL